MKLVIIGCGAGGATAAQFARKNNRSLEIGIFTSEGHSQYSKCALPFVISRKISAFDDVIEFPPEWFRKNGIDLHTSTEVVDIDGSKKEVRVKDGSGGIRVHAYDKLIIGTGALPWLPPIENAHRHNAPKPGIFFLRTMDDARKLDEMARKSKRCAIVGAGLTGLETAEALKHIGLEVGVYEFLPSPLPAVVDQDMTAELTARVLEKGIDLRCGCTVTRFLGDEKVEGMVVRNSDGSEENVGSDFVLVTAGNRPNTALAQELGCGTGTTGGIRISDRCETDQHDVYAVGDCTEYIDFVTGLPVLSGSAPAAVQQGIVAGTNASGGDARLPKGLLNTRVTKVFDIEVAAVGPTCALLDSKGIKYTSGRIKGTSLPHYIKGKEDVVAKLIAFPEGKIMGAQVVGPGAGLRVNTIASAILGSLSVDDFAKMEAAYAPPVAPYMDPLVVAAQAVMARLKRGK